MLQFNPPHPGEIIKTDYIDPLGLTITDVADGLGIARKNLSAIINGRSGIISVTALRLSEAFNNSPELWLNLQANYDLWKARRAPVKRKIKQFFKAQKLQF